MGGVCHVLLRQFQGPRVPQTQDLVFACLRERHGGRHPLQRRDHVPRHVLLPHTFACSHVPYKYVAVPCARRQHPATATCTFAAGLVDGNASDCHLVAGKRLQQGAVQ